MLLGPGGIAILERISNDWRREHDGEPTPARGDLAKPSCAQPLPAAKEAFLLGITAAVSEAQESGISKFRSVCPDTMLGGLISVLCCRMA